MRENYTVLTIYMYIIDLVQFERRRSWGKLPVIFQSDNNA